MKAITLIILSLLVCVACTKKSTNIHHRRGPKSGTMTSGPATRPFGAIQNSRNLDRATGGDVWELVITARERHVLGSSTLVSTNDPNGLNGPPDRKVTISLYFRRAGKVSRALGQG
jgi:hypothetical protein